MSAQYAYYMYPVRLLGTLEHSYVTTYVAVHYVHYVYACDHKISYEDRLFD